VRYCWFAACGRAHAPRRSYIYHARIQYYPGSSQLLGWAPIFVYAM
jgi:hypothetical protein